MARKSPRHSRARTRPALQLDVAQEQLQQREQPLPPTTSTPRGNSRWDSLAALEHTLSDLRALEARRDRQVQQSRREGCTWVDIARVLDVSPQAVQQRYGR